MDGAPSRARGRLVDRPRLVRLMNEAASPVTVLTAGAGFGKSTLVAEWLADRPTAWLTLTDRDRETNGLAGHVVHALLATDAERPPPAADSDENLTTRLRIVGRQGASADTVQAEAIVGVVADALEDIVGRRPALALVLDDLHELDGAPAASIVAGLVRRVPRGVQLVITTRSGLAFATERLRARGDVLELTARDLALDVKETTRLAKAVLGPEGGSIGRQLHDMTEGWPAAARLMAESVRSAPLEKRPRLLAAASHRGDALFAYLTEEVLDREPAGIAELIRTLAPHDIVDEELALALGLPEAAGAIRDLERRGIFISSAHRPGMVALHRLVRDFAQDRLPLSPELHAEGQRAAVLWHERRGEFELALATAANLGERALLERLLADHAGVLLARGRANVVRTAAESIPEADRSPAAELALGDALAYGGRANDALAAYRRGMAPAGRPTAAVAWRIAKVHNELGNQAAAAEALADADPPATATDEAFVLAYTALVRLFAGGAGEQAEAVGVATNAVSAAERSGDLAALSVAHMAAGYALFATDPARARQELARALDAADRAGDIVQIARLRNADDAIPSLEQQFETAAHTLALVEAAGNPGWLARSLVNRGLVAQDLGRYEVAAADLGRAREIFARTGTTALAVAFLAELARIRGDTAQATHGFRSVIETTDAVNDKYLGSFARAGLARVVALTDPPEARRLIDRSLADAVGMHRHDYLVASAWIAAVQGRNDDARADAAAAIALAGDAPGRVVALASALEVLGVLADTQRERLARLAEAAAIYERIGNVPAATTTRLAIAVFRDGVASRPARLARRQLEAAGVRASAAESAGLLAMLPAPDVAPLAIRVLGGFAVLRDGRPVETAEWKSRKARDLLKYLVARRGLPATRDELAEVLWPDEDADGLSNRLSVALSLLRGVLDPERAHPADHFITMGRSAVMLRRDAMAIDLEDFVGDARAGLERLAVGSSAEAEALLVSADARYAGELLPEDAFADWAISSREEARALYMHVTRGLGQLAADRGDLEAATRYLMRAIAADPYDEPAHLELVRCLRSGRRHGEARRAYELYVGRMAELDLEPAPFPS